MYCQIHYEFGFKIAELAGKKKNKKRKKEVGERHQVRYCYYQIRCLIVSFVQSCTSPALPSPAQSKFVWQLSPKKSALFFGWINMVGNRLYIGDMWTVASYLGNDERAQLFRERNVWEWIEWRMIPSSQSPKKKKHTHNYYNLSRIRLWFQCPVFFRKLCRNVNLFLTSYHLNVLHRIMALLFLICNKAAHGLRSYLYTIQIFIFMW